MKPITIAISDVAHAQSEDNDLLIQALSELGYSTHLVAWDNQDHHWQQQETVLPLRVWDYYQRIDAFTHWLEQLSQWQIPTINPSQIIQWNFNKAYLLELEQAGIPIPRTAYFRKGDAIETESLKTLRQGKLVVKPAISASSHKTRVFEPEEPGLETYILETGHDRDVMVQEFMPEIFQGEYSLILINGQSSHCILKSPRQGEFRVQSEFGGSENLVAIDPAMEALAHQCLAALTEKPVYARFDVVKRNNHYLLMELELIEPDLFLRHCPESAQHLAQAIHQQISQVRS